jgi:hypothetical protein
VEHQVSSENRIAGTEACGVCSTIFLEWLVYVVYRDVRCGVLRLCFFVFSVALCVLPVCQLCTVDIPCLNEGYRNEVIKLYLAMVWIRYKTQVRTFDIVEYKL